MNQTRMDQYDRLIRRIRNDPRLFTDDDHKVHRILGKALARRRKVRGQLPDPTPRGPYSGMTRRELAATGTCEPDWF